jgi:UrcA family protein
MNRCFAAFLALLCASLTVSSACFAQSKGHATRLVPYSDADLSTPAALKALHRRIDLTANQVCLDVSGPAPGGQVDAGCRAEAVANARSQIEHAIARQNLGQSPALAAAGALPEPFNP